MALFHINNFSCHVTLLSKRKIDVWVISRLFCGSNGSTIATHFQRCSIYIYLIQNTYGVKKARPSKVESYLEVNT